MRIDRLSAFLVGLLGLLRTALPGRVYAVDLKFSRSRGVQFPRWTARPTCPLRLSSNWVSVSSPKKSHVPVFVIDHLERPTED